MTRTTRQIVDMLNDWEPQLDHDGEPVQTIWDCVILGADWYDGPTTDRLFDCLDERQPLVTTAGAVIMWTHPDGWHVAGDAEDYAPLLTSISSGAVATCRECGRRFDLSLADDAAEWTHGHDCEVPS